MSTVKCIGLMAGVGAAVNGGLSLYQGMRYKKQTLRMADDIAKRNNGRIPTGGMTKDGKMWDGFLTVEQVKKDTNKRVALISSLSAVKGAVITGAVSGLTLLAKNKLFK